jgi:transcriptional regulator with XRE-family HTH domain
MARNKDYSVRGDRIRFLRLRKKHWKQEELAAAVGMSVGQISRLEAGKHQAQLKNVEKIAEALEVDVDELIEWHLEYSS